MLIICNKPEKKLFITRLTISAISRHLDLTAGYFKLSGLRNSFLYLLDQGEFELNYFPAAEADQVMVLGRRFDFIMVVGLIKMKFFYQTQLLKFLKGAVDGGQA